MLRPLSRFDASWAQCSVRADALRQDGCMGVGAASSTAALVCQGRATADGRYAVGRFSDPVAWHLLDPGERTVVEQARRRQPSEGGPDRMVYELVWRTGILMVPRTL